MHVPRPLFSSTMLALLLLLPLARADLIVRDKLLNSTLVTISSISSAFGPHVDAKGLHGTLVLASPLDACFPLNRSAMLLPYDDDEPWIVLIARSISPPDANSNSTFSSGCTFIDKVFAAEASGATAALVYDPLYDGIVIMSRPANLSSSSDPTIPSHFVTRSAGLLLHALFQRDRLEIIVLPDSYSSFISLVGNALTFATIMMFFLSVLYVVQRVRLRRVAPGSLGVRLHVLPSDGAQRLSQIELQRLPIALYRPEANKENVDERLLNSTRSDAPSTTPPPAPTTSSSSSPSPPPPSHAAHHAGGTSEACTICLEEYHDEERIRILPCQHCFHADCVDPWLLERNAACPVCKMNIAAALEEAHQDDWVPGWVRDVSLYGRDLWRRVVGEPVHMPPVRRGDGRTNEATV